MRGFWPLLTAKDVTTPAPKAAVSAAVAKSRSGRGSYIFFIQDSFYVIQVTTVAAGGVTTGGIL